MSVLRIQLPCHCSNGLQPRAKEGGFFQACWAEWAVIVQSCNQAQSLTVAVGCDCMAYRSSNVACTQAVHDMQLMKPDWRCAMYLRCWWCWQDLLEGSEYSALFDSTQPTEPAGTAAHQPQAWSASSRPAAAAAMVAGPGSRGSLGFSQGAQQALELTDGSEDDDDPLAAAGGFVIDDDF